MPDTNDRLVQGDLFFQALVESYVTTPRFLRRDWLAAEVNERLGMPACRFVLLTAAPGAGKSTFMAQLAKDHEDWPRYFIRRDQRTPLGDVGAHSFLLRIGFQLAAAIPRPLSRRTCRWPFSSGSGSQRPAARSSAQR